MRVYKGILAVLVLLTVLAVGSMYVLRLTPSFRARNCADCPTIAVVLNPFRDRGPEREVNTWLNPGTLGRWDEVTATNTPIEWNAMICGKSSNRLRRWRLSDREDTQLESFLHYRVWCSDYEGWIDVRVRRGAAGWTTVWFKPMPLGRP
jgi:hypothetical protein